jgi:plastocyanin
MTRRKIVLEVRNGNLKVDPKSVRVDGGDDVVWVTADGELTIEFPSDKNPFTSNHKIKAQQGVPTVAVRVHPNVSTPDKFKCKITIGNHEFDGVTGVDTPGTN